jgi:hypothetical protein
VDHDEKQYWFRFCIFTINVIFLNENSLYVLTYPRMLGNSKIHFQNTG